MTFTENTGDLIRCLEKDATPQSVFNIHTYNLQELFGASVKKKFPVLQDDDTELLSLETI